MIINDSDQIHDVNTSSPHVVQRALNPTFHLLFNILPYESATKVKSFFKITFLSIE